MCDIVEFRHLRYFLAVAQEGSFSRAAERLHISQPSLSLQIKQIEDCIPAQLFVREKAGVMLTPAGHAILPVVQQLMRIREQLFDTARAIHRGTVPPLTMGFSPFANHTLVEWAFECYQRLFPESTIHPTADCTTHLLSLLAEKSIDAALVTLPIDARDLIIQPVAKERLLVCMRKDDPNSAGDAISPSQLSGKLVVSFDPKQHPIFYAHLDSMLSRAGITMRATHVGSSPSDMQWMVKQHLGYALVQESRLLDPELIAKPIAGIELLIETAFVYRATNQSPQLSLLACELKNTTLSKEPPTTRKRQPEKVRSMPSPQMKLLG